MAEGSIRVNKVLKDYNIGLSTLTDFLKKKGINDELTLTSKISADVFALVAKEFGKEQLIKEQSQKVSIKLKEITDVESSRPSAEEEATVRGRPATLARKLTSFLSLSGYISSCPFSTSMVATVSASAVWAFSKSCPPQ